MQPGTTETKSGTTEMQPGQPEQGAGTSWRQPCAFSARCRYWSTCSGSQWWVTISDSICVNPSAAFGRCGLKHERGFGQIHHGTTHYRYEKPNVFLLDDEFDRTSADRSVSPINRRLPSHLEPVVTALSYRCGRSYL